MKVRVHFICNELTSTRVSDDDHCYFERDDDDDDDHHGNDESGDVHVHCAVAVVIVGGTM